MGGGLLQASLRLPEQEARWFFHPLFQILAMGIHGALLTGDLFNLYVFFEIFLMASYGLVVFGNREFQLRETVKFFLLNFLTSTLLVVGVAWIYGNYGTLNMEHLMRLSQGADTAMLRVVALLLALTFGMKAAIVPLHFWLPDAYPQAPPGVVAYLSGTLTKVGIYALLRILIGILGGPGNALELLLLLSAFTMLFGVLGALARNHMRGILAFHIISQIGYMVLGVALATPASVAATIYYVLQHSLVKSTLFLVSGFVETVSGSDSLKEVSGVSSRYPLAGLLFLGVALSLAGVPPLSGFYPKYALVLESFRVGLPVYGVVALLTSLLTLLSMMKIWTQVFWGPPKGLSPRPPRVTGRVAFGVLVMVLISLAFGLGVGRTYAWCASAGEFLLSGRYAPSLWLVGRS